MGELTRRGARRSSVAVAVLAVVVATAPAVADELTVTVGAPDADAPAPEEVTLPTDPVDLGVVAGPVVFAAGPGVALQLADGRRYLDRLELRQPGEGQVLVNDLTVDDYVAGVAEMPGRWHLEALKAQAIAARTYAWHQAELGTFTSRGYDICDTVDCQAFRGAAQQEDDDGDRWRTAVDETAGQVLLDGDGQPILARYFSTSGGRTLANEVVFPRSGPRPYLVGVDDPYDAVSPYHRWRVTFTRDQFDAILARGETLSAATPVASVERLGPVDEPGAAVRVTGTDGTPVTVDSVALRTFVSSVAPQLFPDRFPTARADGLRPLPTTLPSSRFEVTVAGDEVVVDGRGWGHGVGMGQYGARGRAEDGDDHVAILSAYYAGLTPTTTDRLPDRIRVGLSDPAVGSVTPDGPMTITGAGEVVVEAAAGTWSIAAEGDGVRLTGPPGWGEPAVVSRTEAAIGVPTVPRAVAVEAVTGVPGTVVLEVTDAAGDPVLRRPLRAADAGRQVAVWDLTDEAGEPVPPGTYLVAVGVTAGDGSTAATPVAVELEEQAAALPALVGPEGDRPGPGAWSLVAAGGAVAVALLARRRGRPHGGTRRGDGAERAPDDHDPDRVAVANLHDPRRSR